LNPVLVFDRLFVVGFVPSAAELLTNSLLSFERRLVFFLLSPIVTRYVPFSGLIHAYYV
jgi:hypothetical protein